MKKKICLLICIILMFSSIPSMAAKTTTGQYEAEKATKTTTALTASKYKGYTGTGYVNLSKKNAKLTFKITWNSKANKDLSLRYALGKSNSVQVKLTAGKVTKNLTLKTTKSWNSWSTSKLGLNLKDGAQDISIQLLSADGVFIDKLTYTVESQDNEVLSSALHDIAINAKVANDYSSNKKPTSITRPDGINKATIHYSDNGSIDYIKTDSSTLIAHKFSKARIMCSYSACPDSQKALEAHASITSGTYDFKKNPAGVKIFINALSKDVTLENFRKIANNNAVTSELLEKMRGRLGYLQFGAVIYDKSSKGDYVGKYIFVNSTWFTDTYPVGTYFCIDPENKSDFGKEFNAAYTTSYGLIP